ncbi:MAG: RNA polymerase sigma factor [Clostridia bacterium]|nr:RNA polymerase sigma factor [Clostridia bacterium]
MIPTVITICAAIDAILDESERIMLTRLYETYSGMILGYIRKKFSFSDADAEDALIDIFHKIILYRDTFKGIDQKEEHRKIIIITRSVCINAWKRRQLEQEHFCSADTPLENGEGGRSLQEYADTADFADEIITGMADTDSIARIFEILHALPPPAYEIILLKYIENFSNVRIARELGMNVSTVSTVLSRTLQKIKKEMRIENK